ncbi:MAG: sialate O-acetylesterase [Methylococcaceae bacterium]|nr:sialate O-acetylesterase [Methylococcaceae bacterium]
MTTSCAYMFKWEYEDLSEKQEVDCQSLQGKTMVMLAMGQSNSANHGEVRYTPKRKVYNFFRGKCYRAADPLLGATGDRGSVWTRFADRVIEAGLYGTVLIASVGATGTPIGRWKSDGDLHHRILAAIEALHGRGFRITQMFWHQGEQDTSLNTAEAKYKASFLDMLGSIRKQGVDAPIYVAVASWNGDTFSQDVERAQMELPNPDQKIYPGPNTDEWTGATDRYGVHFSDAGLNKVADSWLQRLKAQEFPATGRPSR